MGISCATRVSRHPLGLEEGAFTTKLEHCTIPEYTRMTNARNDSIESNSYVGDPQYTPI